MTASGDPLLFDSAYLIVRSFAYCLFLLQDGGKDIIEKFLLFEPKIIMVFPAFILFTEKKLGKVFYSLNTTSGIILTTTLEIEDLNRMQFFFFRHLVSKKEKKFSYLPTFLNDKRKNSF